MKRLYLFLVLICLLYPFPLGAEYDVPSDRQITWSAGSDQWNSGILPIYTATKNAVDDYGADNTGAADASTAINNCLNGVGTEEACYLPAGTYRINSNIVVPSNKVLRGAGPASTVIMSYGGAITMTGGSCSATEYNLTVEAAQGDTSITVAAGHGLQADDWIAIFQDDDDGVWTVAGKCTWCGDCDIAHQGEHSIAQFVKVTNVNGNILTLNRPLYWDYDGAGGSGQDPEIRKVTFGTVNSGVEDLKIDGTNADITLISFARALYGWIKNVETYGAGSTSGDAHIKFRYCQGCELRESYIHHGQSASNHASGANYGLTLFDWNSDHKIEDNIFMAHRHSIIFEGGGSGCAILYNYIDDNWECCDYGPDTYKFLTGDLGSCHGQHPHMNLYESNIVGKLRSDYTHGSSSHQLIFRNWIRGTRNNTITDYAIQGADTWGNWAVDIQYFNTYHTLVGNVIGESDWVNGTVTANGDCNPTLPTVYRWGCTGNPGAYGGNNSYLNAIKHGNYDYITDGVAHWDGGADHDLKNSYYYSSRPSWWDDQGVGRPWPCIGSDVSGYVVDIPAKDRFEGEMYSGNVNVGVKLFGIKIN